MASTPQRWVGLGLGLLSGLAFLGAVRVTPCPDWPAGGEVELRGYGTAQGPLRAGAAEVPLVFPLPATRAGYGPPRPEVAQVRAPLHARAWVLEVEGLKVALAQAEVVALPESVVAQVQEKLLAQGFDELWLSASHTHSSFGNYDPRWFAELGALGAFRPEAEQALVTGLADAVTQAAAARAPATMELGEGTLSEGMVGTRSEGPPDLKATRVVLRWPDRPPAEWVLMSAHPSLWARGEALLDPDYPGHFALQRAARDAGSAMLWQSAVGNGSIGMERPPKVRVAEVAKTLEAELANISLVSVELLRVSFARARVALPRPDFSRAAPWGLARLAERATCGGLPRHAEVGLLQLGPLRLLSLPVEATTEAAQELFPGGRVVSLSNGYAGYLDTRARVAAGKGESRRQLYGPELLSRLQDGARFAGELVSRQP